MSIFLTFLMVENCMSSTAGISASIREYLKFEGIADIPRVDIKTLLQKHMSIASSVTESVRILPLKALRKSGKSFLMCCNISVVFPTPRAPFMAIRRSFQSIREYR